MVSRETVVAEARSWRGVRWLHQGRNRHGIDCVGLLVVVRKALDIGDDDMVGYPRSPDGSLLARVFAAGGKRVGILQAQPADVLLFKDAKSPCHIGIVTERSGDIMYMIHALATRHKVLEEPVINEWQQKWVAAVQMPNVF